MTLVDQLIGNARAEIGKPYIWGDEGPDSFDCSGLMQWIFGKLGIKTPRTAAQQQDWAKQINNRDRLPGDLIFWNDPATHVALYIGGGQMISAPGRGQKVHLTSAPSTGVTYGRVPGLGTATAGVTGVVGDGAQAVANFADDLLGNARNWVVEGAFVALGGALVVLGLWRTVRRESMLDKAERLVS